MQTQSAVFEEDAPRAVSRNDAFLLNIDGYEGPIDVLLDMARSQRVDLAQISILQLARQYLGFVEEARYRDLELAAEYLVMAAWLAFLKSKLLLPKMEDDEEPNADDIAAALQFQLLRLEAMQKAAEGLKTRPQKGQAVFKRGMPEGLKTLKSSSYNASLYDLLSAYGDIKARIDHRDYSPPEMTLMSAESAMQRLEKMLGALPRKGQNSVWVEFKNLLPERSSDIVYDRSSLASTMSAMLEMAKQGDLEIKQDGLFRPIYMRSVCG